MRSEVTRFVAVSLQRAKTVTNLQTKNSESVEKINFNAAMCTLALKEFIYVSI